MDWTHYGKHVFYITNCHKHWLLGAYLSCTIFSAREDTPNLLLGTPNFRQIHGRISARKRSSIFVWVIVCGGGWSAVTGVWPSIRTWNFECDTSYCGVICLEGTTFPSGYSFLVRIASISANSLRYRLLRRVVIPIVLVSKFVSTAMSDQKNVI